MRRHPCRQQRAENSQSSAQQRRNSQFRQSITREGEDGSTQHRRERKRAGVVQGPADKPRQQTPRFAREPPSSRMRQCRCRYRRKRRQAHNGAYREESEREQGEGTEDNRETRALSQKSNGRKRRRKSHQNSMESVQLGQKHRQRTCYQTKRQERSSESYRLGRLARNRPSPHSPSPPSLAAS